jgi:hypothetical protein
LIHDLTQARLRELLDYDQETGVFTWRATGPGRRLDLRAGAIQKGHSGHGRPYLRIKIDGRDYRTHRLAWLYVYGEWPPAEIDHRDGDGLNNRWANLRVATSAQNKRNSRRQCNNTSGFKGVSVNKCGDRFRAQIGVRGRNKHIGYFDTAEAAHAAYVAAAEKHFGEFARFA